MDDPLMKRAVVTLHSPDGQDFSGKTVEDGLAWCVVDVLGGDDLIAWRSRAYRTSSQRRS
jgi:hypothetical protein